MYVYFNVRAQKHSLSRLFHCCCWTTGSGRVIVFIKCPATDRTTIVLRAIYCPALVGCLSVYSFTARMLCMSNV